MIHIFFPAGAFGSTVEYCIRRFSKEFETIDAVITPSGSLHSFSKEFHPTCIQDLNQLISSGATITTPVYPTHSQELPIDTVEKVKQILGPMESVVFITLPNQRQALRNRIFAYFKINLEAGEPVFTEKNSHFQNWNLEYKSMDDMREWERRELLSLEFKRCATDLCLASAHAHPSWAVVTPDDFLNNFTKTIKDIICFLKLTLVDEDELEEFGKLWVSKQQYILEHFQLLETIVDNTINNVYYSWQKLDLVSESMIQCMLYLQGYELNCYAMEVFPSDSITLHSHVMRLA